MIEMRKVVYENDEGVDDATKTHICVMTDRRGDLYVDYDATSDGLCPYITAEDVPALLKCLQRYMKDLK